MPKLSNLAHAPQATQVPERFRTREAANSPSVTIVQLSREELQGMLDAAVCRAVEQAANASGEVWRVRDLASHYKVSERTILNREKAGELPPRNGRTWLRAEVLRWDRDRA